MKLTVEVQDEYTTQSGFRDTNPRIGAMGVGGPTYSTVVAGPVRAGELAHAASLAIVELGELAKYITSVELEFNKPALMSALWPKYIVTIAMPGMKHDLKVRGQLASIRVLSEGEFPTELFVDQMVKDVRTQLEQLFDQLRRNIDLVSESAKEPAKDAAA